ncbi:hypothetical protein CRV019 [Nile crocodilepox virus]|uniref:Uncharacterized protein n=1 Tax=Nile crocodilepox virus (isolate Crocodylus niloticus/Zimbabwe/Ume/2001) TaxID=1289473 RepID=Q070N2_CPRVZ|nr:hypothetical protein CRV019 [Nile crocodilepox virus]ABJ08910.1 hypothetical protein CRV019 [Nile crocodilepox virus]
MLEAERGDAGYFTDGDDVDDGSDPDEDGAADPFEHSIVEYDRFPPLSGIRHDLLCVSITLGPETRETLYLRFLNALGAVETIMRVIPVSALEEPFAYEHQIVLSREYFSRYAAMDMMACSSPDAPDPCAYIFSAAGIDAINAFTASARDPEEEPTATYQFFV